MLASTPMRIRSIAAVFALFAAACGTINQGPVPTVTMPSASVDEVAAWMVGDYSSAGQAAKDPSNYKAVVLHMAPIWRDRTDGRWIYVEQAMADAQDKPYRQRIYRIIPVPGGKVESVIYELPGNPLQWAGAWRDPARLNALDPGILSVRPGCAVVLGYAGPGVLQGSTNGRDCGSVLRGASYASSEVTLTATELNTWDRGYDAGGTQVWGSTKGPYRFMKESAAPAAAAAPEPPPGDEAAVSVPASESVTR